VVAELSQPWAPFLSGISVFANPIRPANFGGKSESDFFAHPEQASTAIGAPPYQRSDLDHPQMLNYRANCRRLYLAGVRGEQQSEE